MNNFELAEPEYRDGYPVEKGIVLTRDFLEGNKNVVEKYLEFWLRYPDLYLDAISLTEERDKIFVLGTVTYIVELCK